MQTLFSYRPLDLRQLAGQYFQAQVFLIAQAVSTPLQDSDFVVKTLDKTQGHFVLCLTIGGKKSLLTLCFHRDTGKELWRHDFGLGVNQPTHEKSNLAVNTPADTEDSVYASFGNSDIARYSHDGKLIWVTRYMAIFGDPKMSWGYSVSPTSGGERGRRDRRAGCKVGREAARRDSAEG